MPIANFYLGKEIPHCSVISRHSVCDFRWMFALWDGGLFEGSKVTVNMFALAVQVNKPDVMTSYSNSR